LNENLFSRKDFQTVISIKLKALFLQEIFPNSIRPQAFADFAFKFIDADQNGEHKFKHILTACIDQY
jgi:hypothetical protein